jgi:hypothetical protein
MERQAKHKARQSKWVSSNKGRKQQQQQQKSKTHPKHMCIKNKQNKQTKVQTRK